MSKNKNIVKLFYSDNRGIGVVEIILILLVLVGLVVLFKGQITTIISSVFTTINKQVKLLN